MRKLIAGIFSLFTTFNLCAQSGHELWLRNKTAEPVNIVCAKKSLTLTIAKQELQQGWQGQSKVSVNLSIINNKAIKADGFRLTQNGIEATTGIGILYGVYELLRRQQTGQSYFDEISNPSYERRILDHWDNLNGTIERGYAGNSIFWRKEDPFTVTDQDKTLWQQYARANASIGINGSVLDNVNASPLILNAGYLARAKAIADVLRPYGVRVYLAVNFASPSTQLWKYTR
jgi:alpha-glucuronidase